jgi:hypothetical protein
MRTADGWIGWIFHAGSALARSRLSTLSIPAAADASRWAALNFRLCTLVCCPCAPIFLMKGQVTCVMAYKPSTQELLILIEKLLNAEGSPAEQLTWLETLERNLPHPEIQGLIFWPHRYGLTEHATALEIVNKALAYKPTLL